MKVLHVSSEVAPFAQSGGLADVVAGLPTAQANFLGIDAAVLVPFYRGVAAKLAAAGIETTPHPLTVVVGPHTFEGALHVARIRGVMYGFLYIAALYDRGDASWLYGPGGTAEYADNHLRFGALGKAALAASNILLGGMPDVLHCHDWQGSPAAIYARAAEAHSGIAPSIVVTVHNLAFRGIFPKPTMTDLGIPWSMFTAKLVEFYDQVSFLKGAMGLADVVTTVSPSYAQEIITPERGEALDGFLRWDVKRLVGIVNGIDTAAWDPATDHALPAQFSLKDPSGKTTCRETLAQQAGLPPLDDEEPLFGVVARMAGQKGLDLVADVAPRLAEIGARLVVIGSGEPAIESRFTYLASTFSHHVAVRIGFDVSYSRRIYGGSDFFLMPSRFEPCGLGQLYAMRYGSIPIVTAVGGLRDTVVDGVTGIQVEDITADSLFASLTRAVALFRDATSLARVRRNAMARDSSWAASANEYVALYRSLRPFP